MRRLAVLLAVLLAACTARPPQPVEIDSADVCASCTMAISEKRYAAELLDSDGNALKFDDIGCMVRYAADHHLNHDAERVFVIDYQAQRWLPARQAVFVRSAAIPTPMSGGLAAFHDSTQAEAFAHTVHGELLRFEDLWTSQL